MTKAWLLALAGCLFSQSVSADGRKLEQFARKLNTSMDWRCEERTGRVLIVRNTGNLDQPLCNSFFGVRRFCVRDIISASQTAIGRVVVYQSWSGVFAVGWGRASDTGAVFFIKRATLNACLYNMSSHDPLSFERFPFPYMITFRADH